jgi:uncharacterized protein (UPF0147 family)
MRLENRNLFKIVMLLFAGISYLLVSISEDELFKNVRKVANMAIKIMANVHFHQGTLLSLDFVRL